MSKPQKRKEDMGMKTSVAELKNNKGIRQDEAFFCFHFKNSKKYLISTNSPKFQRSLFDKKTKKNNVIITQRCRGACVGAFSTHNAPSESHRSPQFRGAAINLSSNRAQADDITMTSLGRVFPTIMSTLRELKITD